MASPSPDNDAFEPDPAREIARLLRHVANRVEPSTANKTEGRFEAMALLRLGVIVATPAALKAIEDSNRSTFQTLIPFLSRHARCDWGDVDEEDRKTNDHAFANGERILSVYKTDKGVVLWIITEWDRSVTTVLLPEDY